MRRYIPALLCLLWSGPGLAQSEWVQQGLRVNQSGAPKGFAKQVNCVGGLGCTSNGTVATFDPTNAVSNIGTSQIQNNAITGPKVLSGSVTGSQIANTPAGTIASTNVQAAINELDTEKSPTTHVHNTPIPDVMAGQSRLPNTIYQATGENGYLLVNLQGSYMNCAQLMVGTTSPPTAMLGTWGDDSNANTKAVSAVYPIRNGLYYELLNGQSGCPLGAWSFETVTLWWIPVPLTFN